MRIFDDEIPTDYQGVAKRMIQSLEEFGLISDRTVGSVARLLVETVAREIATFYEILDKAHEAGYLTTARGRALDNVTALLGVRRAAAGLLRGRVKFSRRTPATEDIVIPAGAIIAGPPLENDPVPPMETVEQGRILRGRRSVIVDVQEIPGTEPSAIKRLPTGALNFMPRPLLGVDEVTNPEPIVQGGQEESDDHLRARAGVVLRESQKSTKEAIEAAVRKRGIEAVEVEEKLEQRGCLKILIGDPKLETNQELKDEIIEEINSAKAAGVHCEVQFLKSVYCHIVATIKTEKKDIPRDAFDRLALSLKQGITDYINGLAPGAPIVKRKLDAILIGNPGVRDAKFNLRLFRYAPETGVGFSTLDDRKEDDRWLLKELERAAVDMQRLPIEIVSEQELKALLFLGAYVRPELKSQIPGMRDRLSKDVQQLVLSRRQLDVDSFENLVQAIGDLLPEVKLRYSWIVHQASGEVEYWSEAHQPVLAEGETLSLGRIDLKAGGGH